MTVWCKNNGSEGRDTGGKAGREDTRSRGVREFEEDRGGREGRMDTGDTEVKENGDRSARG